MDINLALRTAAATAKWSPTRIAFEAGVRESAVSRWLSGDRTPRAEHLETLRAKMPGLAELLNAQAQTSFQNAA